MRHFKLIKFEDIVINELLKGCIIYDNTVGPDDYLDECGIDSNGPCSTIDMCGSDGNSCTVSDFCFVDSSNGEECFIDSCGVDSTEGGCITDVCIGDGECNLDGCLLDGPGCQADGQVCTVDNEQGCPGGDCYSGE